MRRTTLKEQSELCFNYIYNLANKKNGTKCVATNKYLSEVMGKSTKTISRYIKYLKENSYISVSGANNDEVLIEYNHQTRKKIFYKKRIIITNCSKPQDNNVVISKWFNSKNKIDEGVVIVSESKLDTPVERPVESNNADEVTIKKPIEVIVEEYNVVFSPPKTDYDIIAEMDKWEAIEEAKKKKRKAEELGVSEAEITTLNLPKLTWNPEFSQTKEERAEIYKLITEDEAKLSRARKLRSFLKETYGDLEDISEPELIKEYKGYLDIIRKLENGEE